MYDLLSVAAGSGLTPMMAVSPLYNFPSQLFPVPSQRDSLRTHAGQGVVVVNPENFSVSIGVRSQAITVTTSPTPLPASPLEFRRALVLHNSSVATIYLGGTNVSTSNGFPLLSGEKISIDIQGTPGATIYAVSGGSLELRILELS